MQILRSLLLLPSLITIKLISAVPACAQLTASAEISATICTPLTVSKESDLEFTHLPDATTALNNAHRRNAHSKIAERFIAPKAAEASFTISGIADYVYDVIIPSHITVEANSRLFTIGTEECSASGNHILTRHGQDSISIEGMVAFGSSEAVTFNDEIPNGLPVIIGNN